MTWQKEEPSRRVLNFVSLTCLGRFGKHSWIDTAMHRTTIEYNPSISKLDHIFDWRHGLNNISSVDFIFV